MKKVDHQKNYRLEHEGLFWHIDFAEWRGDDGKGEIRVYRIDGDVTTPLLHEALQSLADQRGYAGYRKVGGQ
jgi:hypothetical protein